ncbi:bifunctional epoxide hydrolase 2 [Lethenteron reissneri]|uniref:bifunctional epoxide hydrolase 2 n=1 Tax=Lethenteron reissneri TaxID=7753 RepID=UPI002AB61233|nr:bifunctional epoxide hydrolase 2 [Lethenteron reissneri]
MSLRVAMFDLGGVLVKLPPPNLLHGASSLPRELLEAVFDVKNEKDVSLHRLERGELTLEQFYPEFNEECHREAKLRGLSVPEGFTAERFFERFYAGSLNEPMLRAAQQLRSHGFKTCVLTNNWVDDSAARGATSKLMSILRRSFDLVIESCRVGLRKPDVAIYTLALRQLEATPQQVVFLDDIGANLKPAKEMGMTTILVTDTAVALRELETVTGVKLGPDSAAALAPVPCEPEDVSHGFIDIKPGVKLHYVEMGEGPVVCLCHGFPESWYSWRYQIPCLADAGYRVIAFDMIGYGDSSHPQDVEEYSQENICKGIISFLNKLGIIQATFLGHDWGGAVVWNLALKFPERLRAVGGINTPFLPTNPSESPVEKMAKKPGVFDYMLYFQKPGVAEAEFEKNLERTFKLFFRYPEDRDPKINTSNVRERGGFLVGLPEDPAMSSLLSDKSLQVYVQQFTKSGFRGPLNWYRNMLGNWKWLSPSAKWKVRVPGLMVTAEKDSVLSPLMATGMESWVPNLTRAHIENCGHWTQMERPAELNKILVEWLAKVHEPGAQQKQAKL